MVEHGRAIYIKITATRGSAPRDAGTAMTVHADATFGTIGGGALEHSAIATARKMLSAGTPGHCETIALGPALGQCCGGAVTLRYSSEPPTPQATPPAPPLPAPAAAPLPLWLWGAGHVGRAMVAAAPLHAFEITWVDNALARFPDTIPAHVTRTPAADMPLLAARAPSDAHHLVFTYSHEIDLALCAALLRRGAVSIGLIGSGTKRTRFFKRLKAAGLDPSPIICPIGDKSLGKHPDQIAYGTLRALLSGTQSKALL